MKKFRTSFVNARFKFKFILLFGLFAFPGVLGNFSTREKPEKEIKRDSGRKLLEAEGSSNCTKPAFEEFPADLFTSEARRRGAIFLHFLFSCYLFILMAFVCNDYFVPSIQTLCESLNLSKDVAGATFMAVATSSPELFVNVVGTFVTEGDLGLGTIVGSGVFNILAVPACCGLLGGQTLKIDWWSLSRDCLAYGVTVIILIVIISKGFIDWKESLFLVVLYFAYILVMSYNDELGDFVKKIVRRKKKYREINLLTETAPLLHCKVDISEKRIQVREEEFPSARSRGSSRSSEPSEGHIPTNASDNFWLKSFSLFCWPITAILSLTIPDCKGDKRRKFWPATFFMCIVWIACTSYAVSWMITIMGTTFGIPDSVMGLTFLAAGMSIPEAASSVIVTNQGYGGMGISSSIGSNTFDILLCLGLPWLIKSAFLPAEPGKHFVQIKSQGLEYTAMSLLSTLVVLYVSFCVNGFVLDRKIGITCLVTYLMFLVLASLMELNIFFNVNLPLCAS